MKKFINRPENAVEQALQGLTVLNPESHRLSGHRVMFRADAGQIRDNQVAIISGGGSGHEPERGVHWCRHARCGRLSGVTADGGYAEMMIAETRGIASIPVGLSSAEAARLACAGVTTYNALRNTGLRAGDLVAVQGIRGLGHLGVQFARQMGFRTVAIGRGSDKQKLAEDFGAHLYIDAAVDDAAAVVQHMGGARAILLTGTSGAVMGRLVAGLAVRGKLFVVGVRADPIQLTAIPRELNREPCSSKRQCLSCF